jgi:hypothetical protein
MINIKSLVCIYLNKKLVVFKYKKLVKKEIYNISNI